MNTTGRLFRLTTFGESHGPAMGGVIDGCPAGLKIDFEAIQAELDRRRPGQSEMTTPRNEEDKVEFLSGIFEGKTTGTPIGFVVRNKDHRSADYTEIQQAYRPSHADFTYDAKYGLRDFRGGGRSSARETLNWVVGGAVARQLLSTAGVVIQAWTQRIGTIELDIDQIPSKQSVEASLVRCPEPATSSKMENSIRQMAAQGNTLGGCVQLGAHGVPAGWGDPIFGKLDAELAKGFMGINAVKAVEIGSGIAGSNSTGKDQNDPFQKGSAGIETSSNNSGGIQGGISNGQPILAKVHFKPVATLLQAQDTVTPEGENTTLKARGRHDACVIPRAVPIVEAVAAIHLANAFLSSKLSKL